MTEILFLRVLKVKKSKVWVYEIHCLPKSLALISQAFWQYPPKCVCDVVSLPSRRDGRTESA